MKIKKLEKCQIYAKRIFIYAISDLKSKIQEQSINKYLRPQY